MASNNRIFYACQAVVISPEMGIPPIAKNVVKGVQSVGMSSTFTLDQVFELGQIEIYDNIEEVADIEVTLEKVIDGERLIFDFASNETCKSDIVTASKNRCDVWLALFDDGLKHATGIPRNICWNSGMYTSSVSYSYSVDGSATESVTLVGNDRMWNSVKGDAKDHPTEIWVSDVTAGFDGSDTPISGVVRRVDVDIAGSQIPAVVLGQTDHQNVVGLGAGAHIQSITVSTDMGQENIQELGRFGPYARYATFPIEVTAEFEVIATSGDLVSVSGSATTLTDQDIFIADTAGTMLDLGGGSSADGTGKNKLSSVSYSGGDTGGGNATVSYSFSNFNDLTVNGGHTIT